MQISDFMRKMTKNQPFLFEENGTRRERERKEGARFHHNVIYEKVEYMRIGIFSYWKNVTHLISFLKIIVWREKSWFPFLGLK